MTIRIALLGSTGSIGRQTLEIVEDNPEAFEVVALAGSRNLSLLREQVRKHRPNLVVADTNMTQLEGVDVLRSPEGLTAAATHPDVDLVVFATSGHDAIPATIEAIKANKQIAIANKEAIVCAGELIMPLARQHDVTIRPIDSEHSAIWQSMRSGTQEDLERLIITASGGPFRTTPRDALRRVSVDQALRHPTWSMGDKITLDSATLVNKGLELIEAHWLFDMPLSSIDVVVHPESIVHSLVEFRDGSTIAQLGFPDMKVPIQYALTWPRHHLSSCRRLDLVSIGALTFEALDVERFPALNLARAAGEAGATFPTVYSAADEIAVQGFIDGTLTFPGISRLIETVLARHEGVRVESLETVLEADAWARRESKILLAEHATHAS